MIIDFLLPILKGFYNVIDRWRDRRDVDSFRGKDFHYIDILAVHLAEGRITETEFELSISKNPS